MSKKLAIKGHETRGKEVIELLEMMGGVNSNDAYGNLPNNWDVSYYIFKDGVISVSENKILTKKQFEIFTLEEFLEKYPFKVGDKVYIKVDPNENCLGSEKLYGVIESAKWIEKFGYVVYKLKYYDGIVYREELYPYKEDVSMEDNKLFGTLSNPAETKSYAVGLKDGKVIDCKVNKETDMNKNKREVINMTKETITPTPDITANVIDKNNCDIACPDGYEFYDVNGNLIGNKVMMRPKKPKYPTTYNDCCDILGFKNRNKTEQQFLNSCDLYDFELMTKLSMLKVCRDAYWKIAGEEMGLGKPWKHDYLKDANTIRYAIYNTGDEIAKLDGKLYRNYILSFPAEEMRDAFYENFKVLIEQCKELL